MRNAVLRRATLVHGRECRREPLYLSGGRVTDERPAGELFELDLPDHLVFPGLVNAHDHLHLNAIPPLPAHEPFPNSYAWIAAYAEHRARPAVSAAAAVQKELRHRHGALKNLLGGATTVQHHDDWGGVLGDPAFPVRVPGESRWCHSLGLGMPEPPTPAYGPAVLASFAATPPGQPWIIHLAEGTDDVAAAELSQLQALGCLTANSVLVHGVGLSAADIERVIAAGAAVIWCPSSNLAILGRTLEPRRLFEAGRLALGTDSRLSGARDLLAELKVAAAHSDLSACELLQLASADAARVLKLTDAGGLGPGQYADLLVLRDEGGDPCGQLLNCERAHLRAVVREGVPLIADSEFAAWFAACGLATLRVRLDGAAKLLARVCLGPDAESLLQMEPGLELADAHE